MLIRTSQYSTVTDSSQKFTAAMTANCRYRFVSSVACYVCVGATGGSASAAADSHVVGAGVELILEGHDATTGFVHVLRIGASSGVATLSLIER